MAEPKHAPVTQEHRDLVHQLVQTLSVVCARGNGHTKNCDWRAQLLADYSAELERKVRLDEHQKYCRFCYVMRSGKPSMCERWKELGGMA